MINTSLFQESEHFRTKRDLGLSGASQLFFFFFFLILFAFELFLLYWDIAD